MHKFRKERRVGTLCSDYTASRGPGEERLTRRGVLVARRVARGRRDSRRPSTLLQSGPIVLEPNDAPELRRELRRALNPKKSKDLEELGPESEPPVSEPDDEEAG